MQWDPLYYRDSVIYYFLTSKLLVYLWFSQQFVILNHI